jgi:hypothetical protein
LCNTDGPLQAFVGGVAKVFYPRGAHSAVVTQVTTYRRTVLECRIARRSGHRKAMEKEGGRDRN